MEFANSPTLVFHYKNKDLDRFLRYFPILAIAILGMIPVVLWHSLPSGAFNQINWLDVWQKLSVKPIELTKIIIALIAVPVSIWVQSLHNKNARLLLDDKSLRYVSGLPLLNRFLDWRLDLDAIGSGKDKLRLTGRLYGKQPWLLYRIAWGSTGFKQMRPAAWVLPNQIDPPVTKPTSFFGYVNWKKPENAAYLEQQFSQIPLVKALTQREVNVPKIANASEFTGIDLMSHPRMKVAVFSFFTLLVGAFVLFHLMRHQHYFSQPPFILLIIFGILAGLFMFGWLWREKQDAETATNRASFRGTQVLLACLFAVSAGLCAPSLPLLLASTLQTSQEQIFSLQKSPLKLKASAEANMPDIQPSQALEYWLSLKDSEAVTLPVSRGLAGLWWQYDSESLQDKVEAFYASHNLSPKKPRN